MSVDVYRMSVDVYRMSVSVEKSDSQPLEQVGGSRDNILKV